MQIGIILQARCNSKRLPNKVIKNIKHKSILQLIIERLKNIPHTQLVIATTKGKEDDGICKICLENDVPFYRGKKMMFCRDTMKFLLYTISKQL